MIGNKMKDAASEVIAIRHATRELQDAISNMTLTSQNAEQIRGCIIKLRVATDNLNTWLNDQQILQ